MPKNIFDNMNLAELQKLANETKVSSTKQPQDQQTSTLAEQLAKVTAPQQITQETSKEHQPYNQGGLPTASELGSAFGNDFREQAQIKEEFANIPKNVSVDLSIPKTGPTETLAINTQPTPEDSLKIEKAVKPEFVKALNIAPRANRSEKEEKELTGMIFKLSKLKEQLTEITTEAHAHPEKDYSAETLTLANEIKSVMNIAQIPEAANTEIEQLLSRNNIKSEADLQPHLDAYIAEQNKGPKASVSALNNNLIHKIKKIQLKHGITDKISAFTTIFEDITLPPNMSVFPKTGNGLGRALERSFTRTITDKALSLVSIGSTAAGGTLLLSQAGYAITSTLVTATWGLSIGSTLAMYRIKNIVASNIREEGSVLSGFAKTFTSSNAYFFGALALLGTVGMTVAGLRTVIETEKATTYAGGLEGEVLNIKDQTLASMIEKNKGPMPEWFEKLEKWENDVITVEESGRQTKGKGGSGKIGYGLGSIGKDVLVTGSGNLEKLEKFYRNLFTKKGYAGAKLEIKVTEKITEAKAIIERNLNLRKNIGLTGTMRPSEYARNFWNQFLITQNAEGAPIHTMQTLLTEIASTIVDVRDMPTWRRGWRVVTNNPVTANEIKLRIQQLQKIAPDGNAAFKKEVELPLTLFLQNLPKMFESAGFNEGIQMVAPQTDFTRISSSVAALSLPKPDMSPGLLVTEYEAALLDQAYGQSLNWLPGVNYAPYKFKLKTSLMNNDGTLPQTVKSDNRPEQKIDTHKQELLTQHQNLTAQLANLVGPKSTDISSINRDDFELLPGNHPLILKHTSTYKGKKEIATLVVKNKDGDIVHVLGRVTTKGSGFDGKITKFTGFGVSSDPRTKLQQELAQTNIKLGLNQAGSINPTQHNLTPQSTKGGNFEVITGVTSKQESPEMTKKITAMSAVTALIIDFLPIFMTLAYAAARGRHQNQNLPRHYNALREYEEEVSQKIMDLYNNLRVTTPELPEISPEFIAYKLRTWAIQHIPELQREPSLLHNIGHRASELIMREGAPTEQAAYIATVNFWEKQAHNANENPLSTLELINHVTGNAVDHIESSRGKNSTLLNNHYREYSQFLAVRIQEVNNELSSLRDKILTDTGSADLSQEIVLDITDTGITGITDETLETFHRAKELNDVVQEMKFELKYIQDLGGINIRTKLAMTKAAEESTAYIHPIEFMNGYTPTPSLIGGNTIDLILAGLPDELQRRMHTKESGLNRASIDTIHQKTLPQLSKEIESMHINVPELVNKDIRFAYTQNNQLAISILDDTDTSIARITIPLSTTETTSDILDQFKAKKPALEAQLIRNNTRKKLIERRDIDFVEKYDSGAVMLTDIDPSKLSELAEDIYSIHQLQLEIEQQEDTLGESGDVEISTDDALALRNPKLLDELLPSPSSVKRTLDFITINKGGLESIGVKIRLDIAANTIALFNSPNLFQKDLRLNPFGKSTYYKTIHIRDHKKIKDEINELISLVE